MRKPLLRIPYTEILTSPTIIPPSANTLPGALAALQQFFLSPPPRGLPASTVVLSGAGLSVASGLTDYRGVNGTYRVNKSHRPVYYHEFISSHEARKRYWARSFLGWTTLQKGKPNAGHFAVRDLGQLGFVSRVITQNVDSFHSKAHPEIPTLELHGYLRATVCISCRNEFPRDTFQHDLARLNPAWAAFLADVVASGALDTDDPHMRKQHGIRANPDGDVDLPNAPYTTFRYPACPVCLADPPLLPDGSQAVVEVDDEGAWKASSTAGVLKPAVIMFGESIPSSIKDAAEQAVDSSGRLLVLATSLATYSAWRLAKRAKDRGMPIAVVNIGGVRGEESLFADIDPQQTGAQATRIDLSTQDLLPALVGALQQSRTKDGRVGDAPLSAGYGGAYAFKDMLS